MNITHFKVSHHNNASLGIAKLVDKTVTYKTDASVYAWFEERPDKWLRDFRAVVRKLCKSVGHVGKFSISTDVNSGITVERI